MQALFDDLVRRELGAVPARGRVAPPTADSRVGAYITNCAAVVSKPSLSESNFITRLSTGYVPSNLTDKKKLSNIITPVTKNTVHMASALKLHLAIQKAKDHRKRAPAESRSTRTPIPDSSAEAATLRRSSRNRRDSQTNGTVVDKSGPIPLNGGTTESRGKSSNSELAAFRPSPETARRTRSAAAKARKNQTARTPSECCFCPDPAVFDGKELDSELIGPFVDRKGNAKLFVHFECACWAPQVYTDTSTGQLRRVYDEYCRGRQLKCSECGEKGATIGCYIQRCKRVFHYRCLNRAKAYLIERFFAAFCGNHAHLGAKPSYRILMEAATIADVSAAQRREDTTFGLDAPHSRYTLLRRRETEVIFSRKWKVCSHPGAFEEGKVIFSHRRRTVLGKSDKLCIGDCVRALRISAIDIATGRLAYMSVAGGRKDMDGMTVVEARAALASRENTGLFLLRNLRSAPSWSRNEIELVKSIPLEPKKLKDPSDKGSVSVAQKTSAKLGETEVADGPAKRSRAMRENSADEDIPGTVDKRSPKVFRSARLPDVKSSIKKSREANERIFTEREDHTHCQPVPLDLNDSGIRPKETTKVLCVAPKKTVESAWDMFLLEQLPKERLLRPSDAHEDSLRNMARLWSLLTAAEREEYEQKAKVRVSVLQETLRVEQGSGSELRSQPPGNGLNFGPSVAGRRKAGGQRSGAGLFGNSGNDESTSCLEAKARRGNMHLSHQQSSLPLQSIRLSQRSEGLSLNRSNEGKNSSIDWDELLPTKLPDSFGGRNSESGGAETDHVRDPP